MAKYVLRLPQQSQRISFPDIMRIVNRNRHWAEGRVQFVAFDELSSDFKELLDISGTWKVTRLYIEGTEIARKDLHTVSKVLLCEDHTSCSGICTHYMPQG